MDPPVRRAITLQTQTQVKTVQIPHKLQRIQQQRKLNRAKKEVEWERWRVNYFNNQANQAKRLKKLYLSTYEFCADPSLPTWKNVQNYVSQLSISYLFKFNSETKGCHNLLNPYTLFPRSIPSLLHLGLKSCVHPLKPTVYLPDSIKQFKQEVQRISTFIGVAPPEEGQYIPSL